jgi:hypothetical protein
MLVIVEGWSDRLNQAAPLDVEASPVALRDTWP